MLIFLKSILFLTIYVLTSQLFVSGDDYILKSLNVFFRHGDRTPLHPETAGEFYPNDPHVNETFDPIGFSALTNEGKFRQFAFGTLLRELYDEFLGPIYIPSEVEARSTDTQRTKASTQLVLAGLYPPQDQQVWNFDLTWQPMPVLYEPVLHFINPYLYPSECPMYKEELARVKNSTEFKKELSQFKQVMMELSNITGKVFNDSKNFYDLYLLLSAEESFHLQLPSWTKNYYPDGPMLNGTVLEYKALNYNKLLRKFQAGLPIQKVLRNMKKVMSPVQSSGPKISLYGVHEDNLAGLLMGLDVWRDHVPAYSSAVIIELYEKSSDYYVRVQYYKGKPAEVEKLTLPGCTEFCPISKFIELTEEIVPKNAMETCFGPPSKSKLIPVDEDPIKWIYENYESIFKL